MDITQQQCRPTKWRSQSALILRFTTAVQTKISYEGYDRLVWIHVQDAREGHERGHHNTVVGVSDQRQFGGSL